MRILLVGGGTGGHLYPLLTVAKKIKELLPRKVEFLYLGPVNRFSKKILEENGIKTKGILSAKWRRYRSLQNILDIFRFPVGLLQSLVSVLAFMPDVVFSKGGYGSVAPSLAARFYFIPILIHESDATPGKANLFMGKISDRVAISFADSQKYFDSKKVLLTGNPVRENIRGGNAEEAQKIFNLKTETPVILVLGGSQGSKIINEKIITVLPSLLNSYQVIHQVGEGNLKEVEQAVGRLGIKIERSNYHPYEFLGEEIIHAYKICSLIISRAGAGSTAEIAAVGKPSILIPIFASANDHQLFNAYLIAKRGAAVILKESNLGRGILLSRIDGIMSNISLREEMGRKVNQFYHADAAEKIAKELLYLTKLKKISHRELLETDKEK